MRKWIQIGIVLLFGILLFSAGLNKEKERKEQNQEPQKLLLWSYYETDAQKASLDELILGFNESQKNYEAEWKYIPLSNFTKQISIGIVQNTLPDMVLIDNPDLKSYAKLGVFENITSYMNQYPDMEDYYKVLWESNQYQGDFYGVPFCCNNTALIYNKQMFKEAGLEPPVTWDDFIKDAKILTHGSVEGFGMSAVNGEESAFQILPWILSTSYEENLFAKENVKNAFTLMEQLILDGSMEQQCVNLSQVDLARKFVNQKVAMIEDGPWILPALREAEIPYGIIKIPKKEQHASVIGGENLSIIKSKNVKGAMAFMQYYSQKEIMKKICETAGVIAPKKSIAKEQAQEEEDLKIFVDQMDYAVSRVMINNWKEISKKLSESMFSIIAEGKSAETQAKEIEALMEEIN